MTKNLTTTAMALVLSARITPSNCGIKHLACDDSAFMTGTNIDINGGMLFS
ncbi:hypothetical protein ACJ5NV_19300 [Loktanella agnita]|uniref:hypothetical protein n=1 Tax=Loktanella agnita TaxID=287097 RepID=UPI0039893C98